MPLIADESTHKLFQIKRFVTLGSCRLRVSDVLSSGNYIEEKFANVKDLLAHLHGLEANRFPNGVLCCESVFDDDIRKLVKYINSSEVYDYLPIVLLTDNFDSINKKDIFRLGIDDIFDSNADENLFYDRLEVIGRTKQKRRNITSEEIQLTVASIHINFNIFIT